MTRDSTWHPPRVWIFFHDRITVRLDTGGMTPEMVRDKQYLSLSESQARESRAREEGARQLASFIEDIAFEMSDASTELMWKEVHKLGSAASRSGE